MSHQLRGGPFKHSADLTFFTVEWDSVVPSVSQCPLVVSLSVSIVLQMSVGSLSESTGSHICCSVNFLLPVFTNFKKSYFFILKHICSL